MELCNRGHDEVCYDGRRCPACEVKGELTDRIRGLEAELADAQRTIDRLDSMG